MDNKNIPEWWMEQYGFFGNHYLEGDDSKEGYLESKKQTLEQRTTTEVQGVIKLLNLKSGQIVLDMPCGYGRHAIGLAKSGMRVTGVDLNSTHLNKAAKDARQTRVEVNLKKAYMKNVLFTEEFDAAVNMFYSFGFFKTEEENFEALSAFYNALRKGGKFLFHTDVNIPRIISGKYKTDETRELQSGNYLRIVESYDSINKRINGSWTIVKENGERDKKDYSVRVYTKDEFINLCEQVGFKNIDVYSYWDGAAYSQDSEDMIVVATK